MNVTRSSICATCGGEKIAGTTTFTTDLGVGVVVIRDVPAMVCTRCGSEWLDSATVARIQETVDLAKNRNTQVEVLAYA